MTPFAFAIVVGLAFTQASIAAPRQDFTACLKDASTRAEAQKVATANYSAFALQECAAKAAALKSALVSFDVKNGVKRTQASADAQLQLDDYVAMSQEKYESRMAAKGPAPAQQAAPQAVPAAAPAPPKN